ncbi:hypothetical protein NC652_017648 [Populus alba x Populus x berolinensis]|nr:hypothetical protein NC652_017648 [Populus alba x Populus x berolinensis]
MFQCRLQGDSYCLSGKISHINHFWLFLMILYIVLEIFLNILLISSSS